MLFFKTRNEKSELDEVIDTIKSSLIGMDESTEVYSDAADQLVKLYTLRAETDRKQLSVSPDTLLIVAGNLLGILIIVGYEQRHVITSKALSFIIKSPR